MELELRGAQSKIDLLEKTNRDLSSGIKKVKEQMEEEKLGYENTIKRVEIR